MKIVEFFGISNRPTAGSKTELYLDTVTGVLFRWTGSAFAAIALAPSSNGNGLVDEDGVAIPTMLKNKTVWYRLRHKSGTTLVDSMGNGPDIPVVAVAGTPNLWTTAKMAMPPNDGSGKATTYARVIGNAYLESLFSLENLVASQGLLFFAADIYPQVINPAGTQTIFQFGYGTGGPTHTQAIAFTQHSATGVGRVRITDAAYAVYGETNNTQAAETAQLSVAGGAGATRSALCGYVDMLNMTLGVSLNGGAFTTASIPAIVTDPLTWDDAEANAGGFCMFAVNPASAPGAVPTVFMGGAAANLGTKCSGLFITRFDTHPGLDLIDQLATSFYDTVGNFPADLQTGKY
jgi:hypothetical protein